MNREETDALGRETSREYVSQLGVRLEERDDVVHRVRHGPASCRFSARSRGATSRACVAIVFAARSQIL
jgi:hypothetical protein